MSDFALDRDLLDALRTARRIVALTGAGVSGGERCADVSRCAHRAVGEVRCRTPRDATRVRARSGVGQPLVRRAAVQRRALPAERWARRAGETLQQNTIARGGHFSLITQNVDRLHQAAGSIDVIELHGSLWMWRCLDCGTETEERGPAFETFPPRCTCGGLKRPGVVWFGESLPREALKMSEEQSRACDMSFSIGTSSVVYPAAGLIDVAMRNGARVVEVNPVETPFSTRADWSVRGKSGEVLPKLVDALSRG
jgi:NAD-dependent deacetylase